MKRARQKSSGNKKSKKDDQICGKFGVIESVSLRNFMCHDNLEFKFEPHVNFIIGQNGSGKSAVLTAILLALGGRSSTTGRYTNAKGFIKTGKHKARIEVVLRNSGSHPYKPDAYGDKISVVREISSDGGSGYKLMSENGRIVSTHKEELNNILNEMDIQIENPVSILTQESSRNFLLSKHGKAEKLYQFFYQGTGLDTLEKNYEAVRLMKDEAISEIQKKKEILPQLEKEVRQLKKKLATAAKVADYKNELLWAGVIEIERRLQQKEEEYKEEEENLSIKKRDFEKCKDMFTKKSDELKAFDVNRRECDALMTNLRNALAQLKTERENDRTVYRSLEGKLTLYRREEKKLVDDMLSLEHNINENAKQSQHDINEEKRLRESKLLDLGEQIASLQSDMEKLNESRNAKLLAHQELNSKIESLKAEAGSCSYTEKNLRDQLNRVTEALKNKVNIFGNQTQNVLNEIKSHAHRFQKLPLGPIGMYLEVKDPRWSNAVEACISPDMLRSFCCDNTQDSNLLRAILKKYYAQRTPSIIVSQYVPIVYDVSAHKAQTNFPTVLDMLCIKNPVIANCLIDQLSIESRILIEDIDTAVKTMISNPPQNVFNAFTMNCDTVFSKPYRFYSAEKQSQNLLTSIRKDEINALESQCKKASDEYKGKMYALDRLKREINQIPLEIGQLDQHIVQLSVRQRELSQKVQDLRCAEEPKDVDCLKEDLQQLQIEHEKKKVEVKDCEIKFKELRTKLDNIRTEIESKMELLEQERKKYSDLCTGINSVGQDKESLDSAMKKYKAEIKETEKKVNLLKEEFLSFQENTEIAVKNAEEVCPRIDTDRSCETLRRLLSETEKVIEQHSESDRIGLQKQYTEKFERIKDVKQKLLDLGATVKAIDQMHTIRRQNFNSICKFTQNVINLSFINTLTHQNFQGKLDFNPRARLLVLDVHPDKTAPGTKKGTNCSTLSGGERSFVTLAFLVAMWDRLKSPFKILDEYDVFMDSNRRKLCIDLLIKHAQGMPDCQFLFLSPLDLPHIKNCPLVKIHKMPPPKRPCQETS